MRGRQSSFRRELQSFDHVWIQTGRQFWHLFVIRAIGKGQWTRAGTNYFKSDDLTGGNNRAHLNPICNKVCNASSDGMPYSYNCKYFLFCCQSSVTHPDGYSSFINSCDQFVRFFTFFHSSIGQIMWGNCLFRGKLHSLEWISLGWWSEWASNPGNCGMSLW